MAFLSTRAMTTGNSRRLFHNSQNLRHIHPTISALLSNRSHNNKLHYSLSSCINSSSFTSLLTQSHKSLHLRTYDRYYCQSTSILSDNATQKGIPLFSQSPLKINDDRGDTETTDEEFLNHEDVTALLKQQQQQDEEEEDSFDYTTYHTLQRNNLLPIEETQQQQQLNGNHSIPNYPKGKPDGFSIVKHYCLPSNGFTREVNEILSTNNDEHDDNSNSSTDHNCLNDDGVKIQITPNDLARTVRDGTNTTLPIALMFLDPLEYPSMSRARKACRNGYILIHRGPLEENQAEGEKKDSLGFNPNKLIRGRVGDRVYPLDVVAKQVRMGGGFYPSQVYAKPPFELPVVYEDDHFAIVNKPAGVVVYSHRNGGHGSMTVRSALPFVLKPPKQGTLAIIRRPMACHRLDKPTSGLLLVAKTKPAMVDLTRQFVERRIKKTYTAILNGIPEEPIETRISTSKAKDLGVDVTNTMGEENEDVSWQLIDHILDEKSAVTVWRPLKYVKSLKANCGVLTLVEMKPKTGRYHQLRRHMSWVQECPIVGDTTYDGGGEAMQLRGRGLFLCSNKISLDHPYYNTEVGRKEWDALPDKEKWANGKINLSHDGAVVKVQLQINLPKKFHTFLAREEERDGKFNNKS